jgi:hypothetical protein
MKYIYCVVIPLLLQILTVYIIIEMNTGNGSWVGLLVYLFALFILPATTIFNATRTKSKKDTRTLVLFGQNLLVAYLAPVILVAIFILFTIAESLV